MIGLEEQLLEALGLPYGAVDIAAGGVGGAGGRSGGVVPLAGPVPGGHALLEHDGLPCNRADSATAPMVLCQEMSQSSVTGPPPKRPTLASGGVAEQSRIGVLRVPRRSCALRIGTATGSGGRRPAWGVELRRGGGGDAQDGI
jgi:hypothetical protein